MRPLVLITALALAGPARAEEPGGEATARQAADPTQAPTEGGGTRNATSRMGLLVDAGFPEGAAVSFVYRPVPTIRLFAGPAWSVVAWGAHVGVTVIPWHLGLSPLLSLEGGRYFKADARFLARNASGIPDEIEPLLHDVTYDYAALHVGLELGRRDSFALSLRAGLARVWLDARGTATVTDGSGSGATVTFSDPSVAGTLPSVKLGLQLWF